jgi:L-asparaginase
MCDAFMRLTSNRRAHADPAWRARLSHLRESMPMNNLHLIATGGTFDKHYDAIAGALGFAHSHLPEIVKRCRFAGSPTVEALPLLDSLDMHDADRSRVLAACRASTAQQIVVVHGTDTMRETAQVLGAAALGKTVVITGAMVPYEVRDSDALFNLGFAIACAQQLPCGVYVAMNARVLPWDNVQKNKLLGVFEPVQP